MARMHLATDGYRSKSWGEFAAADAPPMDFVFTVCDNAAGEVCPVWPGQPMTAHWGVPDPAALKGSEAERAQAYWDVATTLKRRIDLMLALPLAALDRLALQHEVRAIGSR
jgi:arsenate reductase